MTKEEAIKILKELPNRILGITLPFDTDFDYTYALNMAIKALEQKPCEDAISRQAVIKLVVANHMELNGVGVVMYSPLFKDIKQLPSVNPQEPKTGHWIISPNDCFVHCSECGLHGDKGIYKRFGWCPNCGAKMESENTV